MRVIIYSGSSRLLVVLVVVDLGELRVDDVFLFAVSAGGALAVVGVALRIMLGIHRLAELHRSLRQRVRLGGDRVGIGALEGFLEIGERVLDRTAIRFANLRAVLCQSLLG